MARSKAKLGEETQGFRGFGSQALPFLRALKENNERDWFTANKSTFVDECDTPMRELVAAVAGRLQTLGIDLAPTPRNPVFRIYRDVRFSKDKSPYKTNLGSALYPGGDKTRAGLVYIHVEPEASFVAAGYYQPEPDRLRAIRQAIVDDPKGVEKLVKTLEKAGLAFRSADALARMPKGFEDQAESPHAEMIRNRSFVVSQPVSDEALEQREFPDQVVKFVKNALPLLQYFGGKI